MTVTERLLKDTESIWAEYHQHPFVQGIADGTLDKEKFKYYMIQDYLYLLDYTKVFSIGTAKAKNLRRYALFAGYTHSILDGGDGYPPRVHDETRNREGGGGADTGSLLIICLIPLICFVSLTRKERRRSWRQSFPAR